ncbi:MAG: hypothetical protein AAFO17_06435 [Pseudomonadota bacterium]
MTVDFYQDRQGKGDLIARFSEDEIKIINSNLKRARVSISVDPYGDTKLTHANLVQILEAVGEGNDESILAKLSMLKDFEVCYGFGE